MTQMDNEERLRILTEGKYKEGDGPPPKSSRKLSKVIGGVFLVVSIALIIASI